MKVVQPSFGLIIPTPIALVNQRQPTFKRGHAAMRSIDGLELGLSFVMSEA